MPTETKLLTIEEIKDTAAKKINYKDWEELVLQGDVEQIDFVANKIIQLARENVINFVALNCNTVLEGEFQYFIVKESVLRIKSRLK